MVLNDVLAMFRVQWNVLDCGLQVVDSAETTCIEFEQNARSVCMSAWFSTSVLTILGL